MGVLVLGLVLFIGVHSVRIVADDWRTRMVARLGLGPWKGLYALVSLLGFALIVWGYALARQQPVELWPAPPAGLRHLAALLTLAAFVLVAAAYVPRNHLQARLGHPMVLGVKLWAVAHLLANNTLADLLLFGVFLLWAVLDFRAARQRDRRAAGARGTLAGAPGQPATVRTAIALAAGTGLWALFAFWLHAAWVGVAPLGR